MFKSFRSPPQKPTNNLLSFAIIGLLASILNLLLITEPVWALRINVATFPGGVIHSRPAKSIKELRTDGVISQKYDYSCGAAALATMIKAQTGLRVPPLHCCLRNK